MPRVNVVEREFHEGEPVVLADGPYRGTPGVFLRLREDPKWADIKETNGTTRRQPVEWLAHTIAPGESGSQAGLKSSSIVTTESGRRQT